MPRSSARTLLRRHGSVAAPSSARQRGGHAFGGQVHRRVGSASNGGMLRFAGDRLTVQRLFPLTWTVTPPMFRPHGSRDWRLRICLTAPPCAGGDGDRSADSRGPNTSAPCLAGAPRLAPRSEQLRGPAGGTLSRPSPRVPRLTADAPQPWAGSAPLAPNLFARIGDGKRGPGAVRQPPRGRSRTFEPIGYMPALTRCPPSKRRAAEL